MYSVYFVHGLELCQHCMTSSVTVSVLTRKQNKTKNYLTEPEYTEQILWHELLGSLLCLNGQMTTNKTLQVYSLPVVLSISVHEWSVPCQHCTL